MMLCPDCGALSPLDHLSTCPHRKRPGAFIVRRDPPERKVTAEIVQHLVDSGASADLIEYARKHIDK